MENNIVQNAYIKFDIALKNISYIASLVPSNLNGDSLALDLVKYLVNPLSYMADIDGGLHIVILSVCVTPPDQTKNDTDLKSGTHTPKPFFEKVTPGTAIFEKLSCHVYFCIDRLPCF